MIAEEVRRHIMSFKRASQIEEIVKADYDRVLKCQKLFEPIYTRSNLTGGEINK